MAETSLTKEFKDKLVNINKTYVAKDYKNSYQGYMNLLIDNPGNAYLLHNLGVVCHHLKQYKEGAGYFKEALSSGEFDNNYNAFTNAANCCVCAGEMADAKEYIQKAYNMKPDDEKVSKLYKKIVSCFVTKID